MMPFDASLFDNPINWRDPRFAAVLGQLQGNILKGHGRETTRNIFLSFEGAERQAVGTLLRAIGARVTSALTQLAQVEIFELFKRPGDTAIFFFLTASGYEWLGLEPPDDPAFRAGMAARRHILHDPAKADWWKHFRRDDIHAMLIVGDDTPAAVANVVVQIEKLFRLAGVRVLGGDAGTALRRRPIDGADPKHKSPGIEHFGYVDGRSQPLMLTEEISEEERTGGGTGLFDPGVGPGKLTLVPDPHGGPEAFGSYLVYRRLEQNVRAFKLREGGEVVPHQPPNLADALGLKGEDRERAGALVVGRFEDGTAIELLEDSPRPLPARPNNNFNYQGDPDGSRCPLHAHIRKTNPRVPGDTSRLMPRRGIPFGERADDSFKDPDKMPTGGVGLLFMAYNQDIGRQFEFVQQAWANSVDQPEVGGGIDPVIGQGDSTEVDWPTEWGGSERKPFSFGGFVTMTGGEYFFAPSITFLRGIV